MEIIKENMDLIAVVISSLALVLSLFQFIRDSSRQKKEATLNAYGELQSNVLSKLNKYSYPMPNFEYQGNEWKEMTDHLANLERFSVGINTGIYSIWVLNRLGGAYFIRQFNKLKPIIDVKRAENIAKGKHYDEFEKTVKMLKVIRWPQEQIEKIGNMWRS